MILISHNMPHVFEVADRIHIHRLGRRIAVVTPKTHTATSARRPRKGGDAAVGRAVQPPVALDLEAHERAPLRRDHARVRVGPEALEVLRGR